MHWRFMIWAAAMMSLGCTEEPEYRPATKPQPPASSVSPLGSGSKLPPRVYGPAQMQHVACVKVVGADIVGENCPSGFAVYGPYGATGAGNDVALTFTITTTEDAVVSVDLSAETGSVLFAAAPEQPVKKAEPRRFTLQSRPQIGVVSLEGRIVVTSEKPIGYTIRDLALNVR